MHSVYVAVGRTVAECVIQRMYGQNDLQYVREFQGNEAEMVAALHMFHGTRVR